MVTNGVVPQGVGKITVSLTLQLTAFTVLVQFGFGHVAALPNSLSDGSLSCTGRMFTQPFLQGKSKTLEDFWTTLVLTSTCLPPLLVQVTVAVQSACTWTWASLLPTPQILKASHVTTRFEHVHFSVPDWMLRQKARIGQRRSPSRQQSTDFL
jgi:hypothetical protein